MIAKEKRNELIEKMYSVQDPMNGYPMCFDTAKQCALISVDEMWNALWNLYDNPNISDSAENIIKEQIDYWQEVKQEINLL